MALVKEVKGVGDTFMPNPKQVEDKWYVVDATGVPLGRLASKVASIIRGKHKEIFAPHVDVGDHVVVINAEKVVLTGKKKQNKVYFRHSFYPGGLKLISAGKMLKEHPERVIWLAVKGMLPHNRLGRKLIKKLRVYRGSDHPHKAQEPQKLELKEEL